VDVRLSPEQRALRDSAAQVADRLGPHAVGDLDDPERAAKLDAAVTASGWRELRTAADGGQPWASGVEVALVAEELGRGLADAAFLGPTLAAELRRLAVPPAADGETVALTPDLAGPAVAGDAAVAVDARAAAAALVLVPAPGGGHALGQVALRAIGSFQAVQHLLADAFVASEGSASVALHAAWAVDALAPADALAAAAVAKAYCARAARSVCETAIQVHGGIGNTWECLAHLHLRRALVAGDLLGGTGASLGTRRRLRPGVAAHPGRTGRGRRRLPRHRAQGLDQLLRCRRLVPGARPHRLRRAPAQGAVRVPHLDAPARRRAAAPADDSTASPASSARSCSTGPASRRPT
jgi:alkylation response protein AidB-like acyl-CoA dehydrogenase